MSTNVQKDAAYQGARDRATRTGFSAYVWRVEDGPGGEVRYEVTGETDIVSPGAVLELIVNHVSRASEPGTCWHGKCSIPGGYSDKNYHDAVAELSHEKEDWED